MRYLLCLSIVLFSILPSRIHDLKFIPIFKSLVIKIERNSPARIALADISSVDDEMKISSNSKNSSVQLLAGLHLRREIGAESFTSGSEKIQLSTVAVSVPSDLRNQSWVEELNTQQRLRLSIAEREQQTVSNALSDIVGEREIASTEPLEAVVESGKRIRGPIEISGGLAVTNEHHLEVRRKKEGIVKEVGRVDLKSGVYELAVADLTGVIEARLISNRGHVMGEGKVLISMNSTKPSLNGPAILVKPSKEFGGGLLSAYGGKYSVPATTVVTGLKGGTEVVASKESRYAIAKMDSRSTTVLRAAAKGHFQTALFGVGQQDNDIQLFPVSMIGALNNLVTGRQLSEEQMSELSLVWGTAEIDGLPVSGIKVEVEGRPELLPVYFNALMIPDPSLKETSANGLFAFVEVGEGLLSLRASRGSKLFGYSNAIAEFGSVAQVKLTHSAKKHAVPFRLFDAFDGHPLSGNIQVQGLEEGLDIKEGFAVANLCSLNRPGYIQYTSDSNDYISARYLYNDADTFVHLPLISWRWLLNAKNALRVSEAPQSGVVVGFVPDFDFEAFVASSESHPEMRIAYFDMTGKWTNEKVGRAGGGFAVFNMPQDVHEIVLISTADEQIHSRVLPIDANTLSVINFAQ